MPRPPTIGIRTSIRGHNLPETGKGRKEQRRNQRGNGRAAGTVCATEREGRAEGRQERGGGPREAIARDKGPALRIRRRWTTSQPSGSDGAVELPETPDNPRKPQQPPARCTERLRPNGDAQVPMVRRCLPGQAPLSREISATRIPPPPRSAIVPPAWMDRLRRNEGVADQATGSREPGPSGEVRREPGCSTMACASSRGTWDGGGAPPSLRRQAPFVQLRCDGGRTAP